MITRKRRASQYIQEDLSCRHRRASTSHFDQHKICQTCSLVSVTKRNCNTDKKEESCQLLEKENTSSARDDSAINVESSKCSKDNCSSKTSLPFSAKSWSEVKKKLKSIAWIQCDNPQCQKWRKVNSKSLRNVSEADKWYCHQNSDPDFSNCSVPEEDVKWYDQLAERSGLKYIKSQLTPGALVWAKMDGYCRWPGIVTPELGTDLGHLDKYEDGEIASYHVEFLGQPHSHGWVNAKNIAAFTPSSSSKHHPSSQQEAHREQMYARGHGRGRKSWEQKQKTVYKTGVRVEDGVQEALTLLPLSPSSRLNRCTYVQGQWHNGQKYNAKSSLASGQLSGPSSSKTKATEKRAIVHQPDAEMRKDAVSQFTSFNNCLQNKTKEERLMLDVEMYKRNERAFIHDVTRFMLRNGLKQSSGPFWQNQAISLFQLFLAVHEYGGYMQVTTKKKWAAIYREVTESPCHKDVHNSSGARLFYYRYLYPYELYVHGKDFTEVVSELKRETSRPSEMKPTYTAQTQQQTQKKDSMLNKKPCSTGDGALETDGDIASDSLREMLHALEENSKIVLDDTETENIIDITFYDNSTPSKGKLVPLTAFEQGTTVPVMTAANTSSFNERTSSHSQQVFYQLKNVRQAAQVVPSDDKSVKVESASASSKQMLQELEIIGKRVHFINTQLEGTQSLQ